MLNLNAFHVWPVSYVRMSNNNTHRGEETLLFAKNFLQHPRMLGSLIPSSRFLVERLLRKVDWKRAKTIVEYGPGVGTITALSSPACLPGLGSWCLR